MCFTSFSTKHVTKLQKNIEKVSISGDFLPNPFTNPYESFYFWPIKLFYPSIINIGTEFENNDVDFLNYKKYQFFLVRNLICSGV